MSAKPRQLKRLHIKRVDLVDKGASYDEITGEGAHVLLWKRDDGDEGDESIVIDKGKRKAAMPPSAAGAKCPSCGKAYPGGANYCPSCGAKLGAAASKSEPKEKSMPEVNAGAPSLSKKALEKATKKALKRQQKKAEEKAILKAAKQARKAAEKGEPKPEVETRVIKRKGADGKVEEVVETVVKGTAQEPEDIYKGLPESVAKELRKRDKEVADLRKANEELIEKEATTAFQKLAESYRSLPGLKTEEMAKLLKDIAKNAPAEYDKLKPLLDSWKELVEKSAVFSERGTTGAVASGSATEQMLAKIEAKKTAVVTKAAASGKELTEAEILAKATEEAAAEDPALYSRYVRESYVVSRAERRE